MKAWSLKKQILVLMAAVVATSLVLLTIVTYRQVASQLHEGLRQKAISLSSAISENVGPGLEFQDSIFVADVTSGVFSDKDVRGVAVFDAEENCIYRQTLDDEVQFRQDLCAKADTITIVSSTDWLILEHPIVFRGTAVGCLQLIMTRAPVHARVRASLTILIIGALLVLVFAVVVGSLMARRIVRPLKTFENAAGKVRSGDMLSPIDTSLLGWDFVPLGTAFNEMLGALNTGFEELNWARQQLETQVRERTAELYRGFEQRQQAEEALRRSEARYRTLFDSATDAIFIVKDDCFVDCNRQTSIMFGCLREDIVGQTPYRFSPPVQPGGGDSREEALKKIKGALHGTPQAFEWKHCRLDGTEFFAEISLTRMDLGGEVYVLAIVRNIDERKAAEEQQRKLGEQLERAQRMESLGMLAGGVAHDLNNMLGPLVGYSELILTKLSAEDPQRKRVERIHKASQDAADVIQDLLALARRGRYEMKPISFNDVVEGYLDSPSYQQLNAERSDVKLTSNLDPKLDVMMGSASHLSKVVMNLVVNAHDAMPEGGTIALTTSQRHLERLQSGYSRVEPGEYIVFQARDTGVGIAPENLEKIFEPYFSKKKMGRSGTGLGLAVVYGIIKDHKGYYDVISEVGKGTEFILYFPVTREAACASIEQSDDCRGTEKILVVDDSAEQRDIAVDVLSSLGYQINTVANGHEAIQYLAKYPADIVVLDMIMETNFDGLDTFREILRIRPGQKAVIVSGFSATDRVNEMQQLGAGAYIKKPYTLHTIGTAVRAELDKNADVAANAAAKIPIGIA